MRQEMALNSFKHRENLVGKLFLLISSKEDCKYSDITSWNWKSGIVRAASSSDLNSSDLSICVEYSDTEWQSRTWIEPSSCQIFLIEDYLAWSQPHSDNDDDDSLDEDICIYDSPVLTLIPVVDRVRLSDYPTTPVLGLPGHRVGFVRRTQLREFQSAQVPCKSEAVRSAVRSWLDSQSEQHLLTQTPTVLIGYRVQVYRTDGTTQWYTAVINSYDEITKELHVTDDTVLQAHSVDPRLVQITLLGEGVLESLLSGNEDSVRLPRTRSKNRTQSSSTLNQSPSVNSSSNQRHRRAERRRQQQHRQEGSSRDSKSPSSLSTCSSSRSERKATRPSAQGALTLSPRGLPAANATLSSQASASPSPSSSRTSDSPKALLCAPELPADSDRLSGEKRLDFKASTVNRRSEERRRHRNLDETSPSLAMCSSPPLRCDVMNGGGGMQYASGDEMVGALHSARQNELSTLSPVPAPRNVSASPTCPTSATHAPQSSRLTVTCSSSNVSDSAAVSDAAPAFAASPSLDNGGAIAATGEAQLPPVKCADGADSCAPSNLKSSSSPTPFIKEEIVDHKPQLPDLDRELQTISNINCNSSVEQRPSSVKAEVLTPQHFKKRHLHPESGTSSAEINNKSGDEQQQDHGAAQQQAHPFYASDIIASTIACCLSPPNNNNIDVSKPITEQVLLGRRAQAAAAAAASTADSNSRSEFATVSIVGSGDHSSSSPLISSVPQNVAPQLTTVARAAISVAAGSSRSHSPAMTAAAKGSNGSSAGDMPVAKTPKRNKHSSHNPAAVELPAAGSQQPPSLSLPSVSNHHLVEPYRDPSLLRQQEELMKQVAAAAAAGQKDATASGRPSIHDAAAAASLLAAGIPPALLPHISGLPSFPGLGLGAAAPQPPQQQGTSSKTNVPPTSMLQAPLLSPAYIAAMQAVTAQPAIFGSPMLPAAQYVEQMNMMALLQQPQVQQLAALWRQKYPTGQPPPPWMLLQFQDELLRAPAGPVPQQQSTSSSSQSQEREMYEKIKSECGGRPNLDPASPYDHKKSDGRDRSGRETRPEPQQSSKPAHHHQQPSAAVSSSSSSSSSAAKMAAHHLPGGALQPWQPAASSGGNVTAAKQVDHHFEESLLRLAASQKQASGSALARDSGKALSSLPNPAAALLPSGNQQHRDTELRDMKASKYAPYTVSPVDLGSKVNSDGGDQPRDYTMSSAPPSHHRHHQSSSSSKSKSSSVASSAPPLLPGGGALHPAVYMPGDSKDTPLPMFSLYGYQPPAQQQLAVDAQRGALDTKLVAEQLRTLEAAVNRGASSRGASSDYAPGGGFAVVGGAPPRPGSLSVIVSGAQHHAKAAAVDTSTAVRRDFEPSLWSSSHAALSATPYGSGSADMAEDLSQPKLASSRKPENILPAVNTGMNGGNATLMNAAMINGFIGQMMFGGQPVGSPAAADGGSGSGKVKRKRPKKEGGDAGASTSKGSKVPKVEGGLLMEASGGDGGNSAMAYLKAQHDSIPTSALAMFPQPVVSAIDGERVIFHHKYMQDIVDNTVQLAFRQEQEMMARTPPSTSSDPSPKSGGGIGPSSVNRVNIVSAPQLPSAYATPSQGLNTLVHCGRDSNPPLLQPAVSISNHVDTVPASIASIEETINRVAEGLFDADSDTLSAPSPQNMVPVSSTDNLLSATAPSSTSSSHAPQPNHQKVLKKAWMQRYNGDCGGPSSGIGQVTSDSADSQNSPFTKQHPPWTFDSVNNGGGRDEVSPRHWDSKNKTEGASEVKKESGGALATHIKSEGRDGERRPGGGGTSSLGVMSDCEKKMLHRKKSDSKKDDSDEDKPVNKNVPPKGSKSSDIFLQDGSCVDVTPRLKKCRECKLAIEQRHRRQSANFCRFYAFRRLSYNAKGTLVINGFLEPEHADVEDIELWYPEVTNKNAGAQFDKDIAKYVISHVLERFNELHEQEMTALSWMTPGTKMVWKRAVQRVREMCDVCDTTLFNFHWVCDYCGFVVCVDCYRVKVRRGGKCADSKCQTCELSDQRWLTCTSNNRAPHVPEELTVTQIIPSDVLKVINRMLKDVCNTYNIRPMPSCRLSILEEAALEKAGANRPPVLNGYDAGSLPAPKLERFNGADTSGMSPLSLLAEAAESIELKQPPKLTNSNEPPASSSSSRGKKVKDGGSSAGAKVNGEGKEGGSGKLSLSALAAMKKKRKGVSIDEDSALPSTTTGGGGTSSDDTEMQQLWRMGKSGKNCKVAKLEVLRPATLLHFRSKTGAQVYEEREGPLPQYSVKDTSSLFPTVPHDWLDHGRLLWLQDPSHSDNIKLFQQMWRRGQPVVVSGCNRKLTSDLWKPQKFATEFGNQVNNLVNCTSGVVLVGHKMKVFWDGFERVSARLKDKGKPLVLKLKDWPTAEDFSDIMPQHFNDLMNALPMPEYTKRTGRLNLASCLPDFFVRPDLGPKMYNAYGSAITPHAGTTNLHLDISDAVNLLLYVGILDDDKNNEESKAAMAAIEQAGCCEATKKRARQLKPGALWHIFDPHDSDKIRDLLNKVAKENGETVESHHDPIHDQSWYLDEELRDRLQREYGVVGYTIVQCLGDAIFIPAGAPHQVRNLHSCIKAAEDFVSPENLQYCFKLTQEFRHLSSKHSNHEDKLQVKNIIYHAIKDAIAVLRTDA